jgi:hypothetical protein
MVPDWSRPFFADKTLIYNQLQKIIHKENEESGPEDRSLLSPLNDPVTTDLDYGM